ncbi:DUF4179 domain-containing protein [Paenibacillus herberti]|uniref:DUF4179 domain-containing protein n=1 Tax=Paenibacillus herberti TaxID=1619309 RepID=A0A229NVD1_9BACL|nr:DUF4179 domain-containing protein [Paenibacillus herberti]OXM13873.1 hypothetical protein CGZ75_12715 [Paenibacillus herberti]
MENEVNTAVQPIDDERLKVAIRSGLERGKRQFVPRRRKRLSLGIAAALICLLVATAGAAKVSPAFAEALQRIPSLGIFLKLINEDTALLSSIDQDLLQPVGQTVEKEGKRLTVEALIADDRRLVIFYSTNMSGGYDGGLRFDLYDEHGKSLGGALTTDHVFTDNAQLQSSGNEDYIDLLLDHGEKMPSKVRFLALQNGTTLEFDLVIDLDRFAGMMRNYEINQTIEIDGQKLHVVRARQSPLILELIVRKDKTNTKEIPGFVNLRLQDDSGRSWSSGITFIGDEMSLFFKNGYFQKPKRLTLLADGLFMFQKGQKVVVDLEKNIMLEAPDDRLSLGTVDPRFQRDGDDFRTFAITLTGLDEIDQLRRGGNILSYNFIDANGAVHPRAEVNGTFTTSLSRQDNETSMYYPILRKKYPQPLTFTVMDYPGYVLQPIELELIP